MSKGQQVTAVRSANIPAERLKEITLVVTLSDPLRESTS
jgi:hypothetical protein